MARDSYDDAYARPVRRLLVAVMSSCCLIGLVILWRIDNPRVERMRAAIVDRVVPNMEWAMAPVTRRCAHLRGFPELRPALRTEPGTSARVAADARLA
jgi:rod shape-determining protein MreC